MEFLLICKTVALYALAIIAVLLLIPAAILAVVKIGGYLVAVLAYPFVRLFDNPKNKDYDEENK